MVWCIIIIIVIVIIIIIMPLTSSNTRNLWNLCPLWNFKAVR